MSANLRVCVSMFGRRRIKKIPPELRMQAEAREVCCSQIARVKNFSNTKMRCSYE